MTSSKYHLHVLGSVNEKLQASQLDAVELACMDTCFNFVESNNYKATLLELKKHSTDLVLIDVETLTLLMEKHNYIPNTQTILLIFKKEHPELANYIDNLSGIRYVVGATLPAMLRPVLATIMDHTASGELKGLIPKLERTETSQMFEHRLLSSAERLSCQEQVMQFFTNQLNANKTNIVKGTSTYPKHFADILDELLMNAIWDAHPARHNDDRTINVNLSEKENVTVKALFDGVNLSLTVSDSQGCFPVSSILKPIKFILGFKDLIVNENAGGAGLGIYLILQKIATISFEVDRGVLTRVTALLRCDQNLRETQKRPRTILFMERHNPV